MSITTKYRLKTNLKLRRNKIAKRYQVCLIKVDTTGASPKTPLLPKPLERVCAIHGVNRQFLQTIMSNTEILG